MQKGIPLLAPYLGRICKMSLISGRIADLWKIIETVLFQNPAMKITTPQNPLDPQVQCLLFLKTWKD